LFDCLIRGGHLVDGERGTAFRADLGVNFAHGHRLAIGKKPDGKIGEIGDLSVSSGKLEIEAEGSLVIPGSVAFVPELTAGSSPTVEQLSSLLSAGTTTVLGAVDIRDRNALDALTTTPELPINVGYVAMLNGAAMLPMAELVDRILFAVTQGVLAVVGDPPDVAIRRYLEWFGIPVLKANNLPPKKSSAPTYAGLAKECRKSHELLGLGSSRGRIRRDAFSDFQFFALDEPPRGGEQVNWQKLRRIMVAGEIVWENGKMTWKKPGTLLRSAAATAVARP
jgi:hypothetical protein